MKEREEREKKRKKRDIESDKTIDQILIVYFKERKKERKGEKGGRERETEMNI